MQKNLKIQSNFIKINYTKDIFKKKLKITIFQIKLYILFIIIKNFLDNWLKFKLIKKRILILICEIFIYQKTN